MTEDTVPEGYWEQLSELLNGRPKLVAQLRKARDLAQQLREQSFCATHRFKLETCHVFHELCDVLGVPDDDEPEPPKPRGKRGGRGKAK